MTEELHSAYRQLNELTGSANAVREFLREVQFRNPRAKSEIHVSGNKDELIRNLSRAVGMGFASLDDVHQLLWDLEEAGKQHILWLKPAPDELASPHAAIGNPQAVAAALFDRPFEQLFPRYEYPTRGFVWSDFRISENGGWLAKAYGREVYRQRQGDVILEEFDDGTFEERRRYQLKEVKSTLVASWRPVPGILELRIDITNLQTDKTIDERRSELWTLLAPAFTEQDVIGVDIDGLLNNVIFEREKPENQERFLITRVELIDPRSGQIRVIPKSSDAIDSDPGRKASLEAMHRHDFEPSLARVEWKHELPGCPGSMMESVPVVVEKTANGPEIRILKRLTTATYEYIFDQLRRRL